LDQDERVPTARVDTFYTHNFDERVVHDLKHDHTHYLVWDNLSTKGAAALKVLLVHEEHIVLFNVKPEAEEEGREKGHYWHGDAEK
jgi:hypothetical protein